MKKIDIEAVSLQGGSNYPAPFNEPCQGQTWRRLGNAAGLAAFGVNLSRIPPGGWSSQRHWHTHEDEFIWVVEGELVLVSDSGEEILKPGDCAGFKAGDRDGHHLINRTDRDALVLEIGNRDDEHDACDYPDIDMVTGPHGYHHRDGTPYSKAG